MGRTAWRLAPRFPPHVIWEGEIALRRFPVTRNERIGFQVANGFRARDRGFRPSRGLTLSWAVGDYTVVARTGIGNARPEIVVLLLEARGTGVLWTAAFPVGSDGAAVPAHFSCIRGES
jgi:hypothetical protein